jgi:hypothetical protein
LYICCAFSLARAASLSYTSAGGLSIVTPVAAGCSCSAAPLCAYLTCWEWWDGVECALCSSTLCTRILYTKELAPLDTLDNQLNTPTLQHFKLTVTHLRLSCGAWTELKEGMRRLSPRMLAERSLQELATESDLSLRGAPALLFPPRPCSCSSSADLSRSHDGLSGTCGAADPSCWSAS